VQTGGRLGIRPALAAGPNGNSFSDCSQMDDWRGADTLSTPHNTVFTSSIGPADESANLTRDFTPAGGDADGPCSRPPSRSP
jgi:hypothetical protein